MTGWRVPGLARCAGLLAAFAALATCACGAAAGSSEGAEIDRIAHRYVELVAALVDRDPDSASGDTALANPPALGDDPRPTLSAIAVQARVLADELRQAADAPEPRRTWLVDQLTAVFTRASIQSGARVAFEDEFSSLFGTPPPHEREDADAGVARRRIETLLPGPEPAAARLAAFEERMAIPTGRLPAVFTRALQECRTRTLAHLTLPRGEHVDVAFVTGERWSGFSPYLGNARSRIDINTSYRLTVDRVLELACHEGYPGHHVINLLREQRAAAGRPELAAIPLFSPESFAAEVSATQAVSMVFTSDQRLGFEQAELFPLAGLPSRDAARHVEVARLVDRVSPAVSSALLRYVSGKRDFIETSWSLQDEALMAHPQATLLFANQFRGFALAYTWSRSDPQESWRRYRATVTGEPLGNR